MFRKYLLRKGDTFFMSHVLFLSIKLGAVKKEMGGAYFFCQTYYIYAFVVHPD